MTTAVALENSVTDETAAVEKAEVIEEVFVTHVTIQNSNFGAGRAAVHILHNEVKDVVEMRMPEDGDTFATQTVVIDDFETGEYHIRKAIVRYDSSKISHVNDKYKDR